MLTDWHSFEIPSTGSLPVTSYCDLLDPDLLNPSFYEELRGDVARAP
jgi:hypothetical protein